MVTDSTTCMSQSKKKVGVTIDENSFFTKIKEIAPKAVVLSSVMPVTFDSPTCSVCKLSKLLSSLCDRDNLLLTKSELEVLCREKFQRLFVSENEAAYLEESTSLQSESPLWYQHRSGRITSSKFHSVRHTSLVSPISLAKSILSKSASLLNVPSLQWGIEHESDARDQYISMMDDCHNNFQFTVSGLHVNPNYPHLGASLDGLVECECCGKGLLERKCPYKFRDKDPNEIEDESFYLQHTGNSKELCHTHAYYFQVQGQLSICARDYYVTLCAGRHMVCTLNVSLEMNPFLMI